MSHAETVLLPEKLARYVDSDKLALNAQNDRDMQRDLTDGEIAAVKAVRELLLGIDLSHSTGALIPDVHTVGLLPNSMLPKQRSSRTLPLDRSLGLDEYTFMRWGAFHKSTGYGRYTYAIDTPQILLSGRTIASPYDITDTVFDGRDEPIENLNCKEAGEVQKYLDSLVTGADWLEIVARRALTTMRWMNNPDVYRASALWLGEIKHFGPIPADAVIGVIGPDEEEDKWRAMLENGFAAEPVTHGLHWQEKGITPNNYDKSPDQLGVDMSKSRKIWAEIIEMANS